VDASLSRRTSEVRYARRGQAHIAYRIVTGREKREEEARDVVLLTAGTVAMNSLFEDPIASRLVEGLADLGRLVVFDRRGIGLSDPPEDWSVPVLTRWCQDIGTVVGAAELRAPVLVTSRTAAAAALLCSAADPGVASMLVMFEPSPLDDHREDIQAQIDGEVDSVALFCPSRADEPGFREWFIRAGQAGASPAMAARAYPRYDHGQRRELAEAGARVTVPVVVLRRPAHKLSPSPEQDDVLALVPSATRVDLPGEDLLAFGGEIDTLLAEITRLVTGEHRPPAAERSLAAVLYSDIVSSTDRAAALGDARWKRLIDRHDAIARACIGRRGGTVVKTMGDGVLAVLGSASSAVRAAGELRAALRDEDLEIRIGLHVGDIDRRGDDISGMAVVIAARLLALASPGEILASLAVVAATAGEPIAFEARGEHTLKGVPGTWPVVAVIVQQ
jgi:class 3 adenylate cyclase